MPKADNKTVVQKKYPDFVDATDALWVDQLREKLLQYAFEQEKCNKAKQQDLENMSSGDPKNGVPAGLGHLKGLVSIAEAPYKEISTAIKEKTTYIIDLIAEKGGNVDVESNIDEE